MQTEWKYSLEQQKYEDTIQFMEKRVSEIIDKKESELVWLLEHPPLYTSGTSAKSEDLIQAKFPVFETGRGGKYTYHGPGQRVGYVMLDLKERAKPHKPDIREYVYNLEEWIIETLKCFGVVSERKKGRVGIWTNYKNREEKIAAIGIRIRKWVTYHGVAINVSPNLEHFSGIIPCGINEFGVTSLHKLGVNCSLIQLDTGLKKTFAKIF